MQVSIHGFQVRASTSDDGGVSPLSKSKPLMHYCIEKFGPDRCMFESNFPVDKVSYSYGVVFNAFKRLAKGYSASERAALFHDTAARVYRIDEAMG